MLWLNKNRFFNRHLPLILSVILLVVAIFGYYIYIGAKPAKSAWFTSANGTWNYRQKIILDHTKVNQATGTTTPLTNFPVLISTTNVLFKSINNGGHVGLDTGNDIVFTSGDQVTKLNHEIETYASTTGSIVAWVKIPSLSSVTDTSIYMYYGNSAETGNEQNVTAVWDTNYKGVWHFNSLTTDSTSNANTLINTSVATTTGQVGGAANFNAAANLVNASPSNIPNTFPITSEIWIKPTAQPTSGNVMYLAAYSKFAGTATSLFSLAEGNNISCLNGATTNLVYYFQNNLGRCSNNNVEANGAWVHLVIEYNSATSTSFFVNGVSSPITQPSGTYTVLGTQTLFGALDVNATPTYGNFFNGVLDEARVSNVSRTADWIKTEFNNQNLPATFAVFQGEETQPTGQTNGAWFNPAWIYRKKIIINHQQVSGTSTLANFPVLISVAADSLLASVSNGGHTASSTGGDILFTSAGGVLLNFEREFYASTTGQLIAWVQIPSLSPTVDTVIYVYYGNAAATDQQNAAATWDANYKGVWHLKDGTNLSVNDSTGVNNGTKLNNPAAAVGQIDGAMNLVTASSQAVNVGTITVTGQITMSAWLKMASFPTSGNFMSIFNDEFNSGANSVGHYLDLQNSSGTISLRTGTFIASINHAATWPITGWNPGEWHYVTGVYDGSTWRLYFDAIQRNSLVDATGSGNVAGSSYIGALDIIGTPARFLNGVMDEVRLSSTGRSADWIKTEYNNQNAPTAFNSIAGEETISTTTFNTTWFSSSWGFRKQITIDHTKINTATGTTTPLTNFPVLISLTDNDLKNNASSTGADILFTSSNGTTKLNHEIETYASSTGQLVAWVQVPSLSNTSDTVLYMYFGNPNASNQSNPANVWDSNYKGVWHLKDGTTLTANDSTGINNGTIATPTATAGKIDGGANFNGSGDNISIPNSASLQLGAGNFSLSLWLNTSSAGNMAFMTKRNGLGTQDFYFGSQAANAFLFYEGASAISVNSSSVTFRNGLWHQIYAVRTGTTLKFYFDGLVAGAGGTIADNFNFTNPLLLGKDLSVNDFLNGKMDEVRVSNTNRSDDWIKTEYLNQNSPSTFSFVSAGLQTQNRAANKPSVGITNRGAGLSFFSTGGTWTNRRQIIINHNFISQTATTTYSSFPFLFSSIDNELRFIGNGGKVASSTGGDILFTAADGLTKLDFEIESYASTTGQLVAWVRIPLLSATADTVIYIYYGNALSGNQQNSTGVWDTNFKGVWHLASSSNIKDSTSDNYTLAAYNGGSTPSNAIGQINGSLSFNGTNQNAGISGPSSPNLQTNTNQTWEFWAQSSNFTNNTLHRFLGVFNSDSSQYVAMYVNPYGAGATNRWAFGPSGIVTSDTNADAGVGIITANLSLSNNTWYHVVGVYDSTNAKISIFVNGIKYGFNVISGSHLAPNSALTLADASDFSSHQFANGLIDEVRMSNIARSGDWIKTEYNNQNSPQTFYVLSGASNAQNRSSNVPLLKTRGGVKFH